MIETSNRVVLSDKQVIVLRFSYIPEIKAMINQVFMETLKNHANGEGGLFFTDEQLQEKGEKEKAIRSNLMLLGEAGNMHTKKQMQMVMQENLVALQ